MCCYDSRPMPADPLRSLPKAKAAFVEPMDCWPVPKLPEGSRWLWEIKLDGYRAVAVKSGGALTLYSHNKRVLNTDQWSERAATIRSELSVILSSYSTTSDGRVTEEPASSTASSIPGPDRAAIRHGGHAWGRWWRRAMRERCTRPRRRTRGRRPRPAGSTDRASCLLPRTSARNQAGR